MLVLSSIIRVSACRNEHYSRIFRPQHGVPTPIRDQLNRCAMQQYRIGEVKDAVCVNRLNPQVL